MSWYLRCVKSSFFCTNVFKLSTVMWMLDTDLRHVFLSDIRCSYVQMSCDYIKLSDAVNKLSN